MQFDNGNVLFTGRLLSFHESCGVVDAHNETASDLWIESATVACFVDLEDFLDPGDHFVTARVRWLVQVDDAVGLQHVNGAICWRISTGEGRKVARFNVKLVEILYKSRRENHI